MLRIINILPPLSCSKVLNIIYLHHLPPHSRCLRHELAHNSHSICERIIISKFSKISGWNLYWKLNKRESLFIISSLNQSLLHILIDKWFYILIVEMEIIEWSNFFFLFLLYNAVFCINMWFSVSALLRPKIVADPVLRPQDSGPEASVLVPGLPGS